MKDLSTEQHYLTADTKALGVALDRKDFAFARALIVAMRESVNNLEAHTEQMAEQDRLTVIEY